MSTRRFVDQLFDDTADVYINAKIRLAVYSSEEVKVVDKVKVNKLAFQMEGITVEHEDKFSDYILNRLHGLPMNTGDSEEDLISSNFIYVQPMPIEKIVEVWDLTGEVRFATPQDLIKSHKICEGYMNEFYARKRYSPNFSGGEAAEDMKKIESFVEGTAYLARIFSDDGNVIHSSLAALIKGHSLSVLFDNKQGDEQGFLVQRGSDKTTGRQQPGIQHEETHSPYRFLHRG